MLKAKEGSKVTKQIDVGLVASRDLFITVTLSNCSSGGLYTYKSGIRYCCKSHKCEINSKPGYKILLVLASTPINYEAQENKKRINFHD
jgi:hypothetical protein